MSSTVINSQNIHVILFQILCSVEIIDLEESSNFSNDLKIVENGGNAKADSEDLEILEIKSSTSIFPNPCHKKKSRFDVDSYGEKIKYGLPTYYPIHLNNNLFISYLLYWKFQSCQFRHGVKK